MLKNVPVVLESYKVRLTDAPGPKTFKNRETGQVELALDRQNNDAQLFVCSVLMKQRPTDDRPAGKGFEVKVTLETDPGDEAEEGMLVELHNPRISEFDINGNKGVSMKATGIKPVFS